jgi:hypothetical protein
MQCQVGPFLSSNCARRALAKARIRPFEWQAYGFLDLLSDVLLKRGQLLPLNPPWKGNAQRILRELGSRVVLTFSMVNFAIAS